VVIGGVDKCVLAQIDTDDYSNRTSTYVLLLPLFNDSIESLRGVVCTSASNQLVEITPIVVHNFFL
jgi:hypothetical protein